MRSPHTSTLEDVNWKSFSYVKQIAASKIAIPRIQTQLVHDTCMRISGNNSTMVLRISAGERGLTHPSLAAIEGFGLMASSQA